MIELMMFCPIWRNLFLNRDFEDWFNQLEGYHLLSERFYDDLEEYAFCVMAGYDQQAKEVKTDIKKWLQAAFEAGVNCEKKKTTTTEN